MGEMPRRSDRVEMSIPIRVRGMSVQTKFFDEQTQTDLLSKHGFLTHLRSLVELESEIHVTSLKNNAAGTFRVAWVNTRGQEGFHNVGLELVESDGDLWEVMFPPERPEDHEAVAQAWLECQRCRQKLLTPVPEAEYEHLCEGFLIAKPCERCKATTPWEFTSEGEPPSNAAQPQEAALEPGFESAGKAPASGSETGLEHRRRGRAPLEMRIKVTRRKHGITMEDFCDTANVSREGVYFLTDGNYTRGESVEVVLRYKEGDLNIPSKARVVRCDQPKDSALHGVALHLEGKRG